MIYKKKKRYYAEDQSSDSEKRKRSDCDNIDRMITYHEDKKDANNNVNSLKGLKSLAAEDINQATTMNISRILDQGIERGI